MLRAAHARWRPALRRAARTLALLSPFLLGSCGGEGRTRGAAASNALLVVGYDREPDTLNRFSTHILEDVQTCVIEGLVTNDEHMNIVPVLAASIPTLENGGVVMRPDGGMDVTWKLRPGVRWHDGVPFTSADVKFTVDAINSPDYNPESTDGFDRISSVDTPDSLTAIVHYREPYAPYQLQFVRGALPRHVLEGKDIDRATEYNRAPLGTGPYRVAEWKTGEYILLERVPNYWRGSAFPKIERIQFKFIPNTTTRVNQLASGEAHVVALVPWDKYRELATIPGLTVHRMPGNSYEHITLNQRQVPAFRDVRVRRALTHAIDRELIARTILDSLAPVVHGAIQPVSWAFTDSVQHYPFDPARARTLLDSAGWTDADGDGIREREGVRLGFTLLTQAGFAIRESVSQAVQRMLRDVGADVKIQLVDGTAISSLWFEGKFDAMLHWWHMPADPEITLFFASDRTPPAGRNINYVADSTLDRLMYASDREIDQARRRAILVRVQQRLAELAPEIPLYNVTRLDGVPAALRNFKGNPTNTGVFWNVWEWDVGTGPTAPQG
ncbi:MAG: peptide ABC transporter substrate-binding protein [Gemmatimonadaceae bacterium]|nr:peptide ABC transporter substrate-binding protein [Gemmatimonadaceae bacterium]